MARTTNKTDEFLTDNCSVEMCNDNLTSLYGKSMIGFEGVAEQRKSVLEINKDADTYKLEDDSTQKYMHGE